MSNIPTQSNNIIVDTPESVGHEPTGADKYNPGAQLAGWLTNKATVWKAYRDRGHLSRWGEYWRLWRGYWASQDKNRQSERSRLIAPALAQAIEMTVSEIEEALFSKEVWFDINDNIGDEDKLDATLTRDQLREDMEKAHAKDAISEASLIGTIFGTFILKVNPEVVTEDKPIRDPKTGKLKKSDTERVLVTYDALRPDEFIPDPAGTNVADMLGCFHEISKPLHQVLEKIEQGVYRREALATIAPETRDNSSTIDLDDPEALLNATDSDQVKILEYHGKVPMNMLFSLQEKTSPLDELLEMDNRKTQGDGPLIEAIVTIANGSTVLRAKPNPFVMRDRSIIAGQFEKVPGRFWGRGIAEKGYNPQKALDAELRSRIDALGFISSPMLGVDSGRIPRGFRMEIKPGKVWLTQGPPKEVLQPIEIGNLNQNTFGQTEAMERMVQMGTGAFDTATALKSQGGQSQGASAANTSLMMGAFVKRSKRSIRNINDNLVAPMIKKSLWRYMQFDQQRYPKDYDFIVKPSLGIVAREVEAMQLTQTLGMMPDQFPQVSLAISKSIVDLSSAHNKPDILAAIDQALAPPSEEEQKRQKELADLQYEAQKAQAEGVLLANQEVLARIRKLLAEAGATSRKGDLEGERLHQEEMRIMLQLRELLEQGKDRQIEQERLEIERERLAVDKQQLRQKKSD